VGQDGAGGHSPLTPVFWAFVRGGVGFGSGGATFVGFWAGRSPAPAIFLIYEGEEEGIVLKLRAAS
jgi:hypothetical protein